MGWFWREATRRVGEALRVELTATELRNNVLLVEEGKGSTMQMVDRPEEKSLEFL